MLNLTTDREVEYNGVIYRVIEFLNSGTLLVVTKEEYDKQVFPMQTYIIPEQD